MLSFPHAAFSSRKRTWEIDVISRYKCMMKSDAEMILTGCLPIINKDRVAEVFTGKFVEITKINEFVDIMNFHKKISEMDDYLVSDVEYNTDPTIHKIFRLRRLCEKLAFLPFFKVPKLFYTGPYERWYVIRKSMEKSMKVSKISGPGD